MRHANEERGEVNLVAGEKNYVLRLSHQAICEAQARTGRTWGQLLTASDNFDYVAYRDVLNVLLRKYHAKDFPNLTTVSELIDEVGMASISLALSRLFDLNAEQAKAITDRAKAEREAANPPEAATSSTGEPPISALDASA